MPVVLVEVGGTARSGHIYGDRTGIEYEYPAGRYEKRIQPGERFVYQVPRVGYVGTGIVGNVRDSETEGRLVCDVLAVELFDNPVGLRDLNGEYYEADPTYWKDRVYWGQGVRPLSDRRLEAILAAAAVSREANVSPGAAQYADHRIARQVEDISVKAAVGAMATRFGEEIHVMPRNNPGFDLRVGAEENPVRYVEVKGTQSGQAVFFMSEGERTFSIRHADRYTLVVVTGVDVATSNYGSIIIRDGAMIGNDLDLTPSQWRGRLASAG